MGRRTGARPSAPRRGKPEYIPERGDIVWLTFSPQAGREQAGRRPALIISPQYYNSKSGLCLACPITSHAKGYPFELTLPPSSAVQGVVLCDQVKSCDWQSRQAEFEEQTTDEILDRACALVRALIEN